LNACRNVPISNITHSTDKVTGIASTSGLPNGLAASYSSNTITISGTPTALGTFNYIITPTGCGSPIAKATGTIIVRAESIATLTTSNMNSCHGREISLGGYVGKTGAWTLTLNDGSTVSGNGNTNWSKTVQPSATTTYSISSLTGSTSSFCPNMFSGSTTITLPPAGNELAKNGESATCLVSGNKYIHFFHSSGRLIGSINPNGQDLGMVEMTMFDNGTSQLIMPCGSSELSAANSVMNKHWLVNQSKITINNVDVRLPFTKFDYTDLEIAANANFNQSDNIAGIGDIRLSKYNGLNENQSALDNCSNGTTLVYEQIGYNQILTSNNYPTSISNSFFVQYRIPGFSELWLHGATDSPLPVELTHFSADCEEELILNWTTASELNSDQFIIEKSRDGMNWKIIETQQAAGNSNIEMYYSLADNKPSNGLFYYRLRQVDFDGEETIYGPISVFCENGKNSMIVFPNPTNGRFTVEIISQENIKDAKLILLDMIGRIIIDKTLNITKGMNQVYFDEENINPGFFTLFN